MPEEKENDGLEIKRVRNNAQLIKGSDESLVKHLSGLISKQGWQDVTSLLKVDKENTLPVTYTIGLQKTWSHPEILLIADPVVAHEFLEVLVEHCFFKKDMPLPLVPFQDYHGVGAHQGELHWALHPVPDWGMDHFLPTGKLYAQKHHLEHTVYQLCTASPDKLFPWQDGYDNEKYPQFLIR